MLGLHFFDLQVKYCQHSRWIKDYVYQLVFNSPLDSVFTMPR